MDLMEIYRDNLENEASSEVLLALSKLIKAKFIVWASDDFDEWVIVGLAHDLTSASKKAKGQPYRYVIITGEKVS